MTPSVPPAGATPPVPAGAPPQLDERKAAVLLAVVREYVRQGEPIGSKTVVESASLGVSAATVRSDMAALEEAGFITHPHTSAGRIPTDKGYRYFVNALSGDPSMEMTVEQKEIVDDLLGGAADLDDLLRRATGALSRLTRFAGLVAAPRMDRSRLKHIELVSLAPAIVLAVAIADTGRVTKHMLELSHPVAEHDVHRARHALNAAATGLRGSEAPEAISGLAMGAPSELVEVIERVADALRQGLEAPGTRSREVFVGGSASLVDGQFERLEEVKRVYETLEEQVVVLEVLREALRDADPGIRIGAELPLRELEACAVVASSYDARGESTGQVGVIGPTRMDYRHTVNAVRAVAATLERAIAGMTGAPVSAPPTVTAPETQTTNDRMS